MLVHNDSCSFGRCHVLLSGRFAITFCNRVVFWLLHDRGCSWRGLSCLSDTVLLHGADISLVSQRKGYQVVLSSCVTLMLLILSQFFFFFFMLVVLPSRVANTFTCQTCCIASVCRLVLLTFIPGNPWHWARGERYPTSPRSMTSLLVSGIASRTLKLRFGLRVQCLELEVQHKVKTWTVGGKAPKNLYFSVHTRSVLHSTLFVQYMHFSILLMVRS